MIDMGVKFKGIVVLRARRRVVWLILAWSQINVIQEHSFVLGFHNHVPMIFVIQFANQTV